jgi:GAF domain-containing protein
VPSDQIKSNKIFASTQSTIKNSQDGSTLIVPITLRGQRLGTIVLRRDSGLTPWESKDLTLVQESVNQISIALDNARLLDDSRRRSEHEQTVSGISSQLSRSFDVESILKTAVRELGQLPNVVDASVHIKAPKSN